MSIQVIEPTLLCVTLVNENIFSGPRIRRPPFGVTIGVLHHPHSLLIALAANVNVPAALVDDLRETIGIGIGTGTGKEIEMIVIGKGEVEPLTGGGVYPPVAGGTTATVTAPVLLQLKMKRRTKED